MFTVYNKNNDKIINLNLEVNFDENLKHPDDLHYPKD